MIFLSTASITGIFGSASSGILCRGVGWSKQSSGKARQAPFQDVLELELHLTCRQ